MNELKQLIKEGGVPVFTKFAVEIGDALWQALYSYLETNFPRDLHEGECEECYRCSKYYIDSIWEEGTQKFAILKERESGKLYRMNFSYTEDGLNSEKDLVEVEKSYVPVSEEGPVFSLEKVEAFEAERYKKEEDNSGQVVNSEIDKPIESENNFAKNNNDDDEDEEADKKCPKCGKPLDECECEEDDEEEEDKKKKYSLEEIPEYVELQNNYAELETTVNILTAEKEQLESQITELLAFKATVDKKEKQNMIDSFYMLTDEDKKEVIDNIDNYSLKDIEAELSIICVRNKVNFNLEDDNHTTEPTTYTLNDGGEADYVPAWVKAVQSVAKDIK